jgi:hypothetical protein
MGFKGGMAMQTHVAYDARSGQIISIHHGPSDVSQIRERAHHRSKIEHKHIEVIPVQAEAVQRGKTYKVDAGRKALVEAPAGEGVSFAFGRIAKSPAR